MKRGPQGHRREQIYRYVKDRLLAGEPPTIREIQHAFGFRAVQSAQAHLTALVAEGRLVQAPGKARGYRLPGHRPMPRSEMTSIPLLGRVQAGKLTTAFEEPEGRIFIDSHIPADELFALRVRGESMVNAAILPGDIVIVRRQATADSGDIVVALVEDEATVKRLYRQGNRVELQAANPAFASICPLPDTLSILGKVIEVRRTLT